MINDLKCLLNTYMLPCPHTLPISPTDLANGGERADYYFLTIILLSLERGLEND